MWRKKKQRDQSAPMDHEKTTVCVLDASTYVGFWILKGLLSRGYRVHAAIQKQGKLSVFWGTSGVSEVVFCTLIYMDGPNDFDFLAGETEIQKIIRNMERVEERLEVFSVDVLDYHSILVALKGCSALFCCLDGLSDGHDVSIYIYILLALFVMIYNYIYIYLVWINLMMVWAGKKCGFGGERSNQCSGSMCSNRECWEDCVHFFFNCSNLEREHLYRRGCRWEVMEWSTILQENEGLIHFSYQFNPKAKLN
jgi:hypothetical protein